jgi:hypothetical protein
MMSHSGNSLTFLSRNIQAPAVENVNTKKVSANIQYLAFFFLKIFFVSKNLKRNITKNIVKIQTKIEKNILIVVHIKSFI